MDDHCPHAIVKPEMKTVCPLQQCFSLEYARKSPADLVRIEDFDSGRRGPGLILVLSVKFLGDMILLAAPVLYFRERAITLPHVL